VNKVNRKYHLAFVLLVIFAFPALMAENLSWIAGPGRMNLGGKAVIQVPQGYLYLEWPFAPQKMNAADAKVAKVTMLGSVRRGLLTVDFSYTPDPNPLTTHLLLRAGAFLNVDSAATRTARAISAQHLLVGKVVENDRFDSQAASLSFVIGLVPATKPGSRLMPRFRLLDGQFARRRATFFFGRHGTLTTEFGAPERAFASMERDYGALLQHLAFVPGEGPFLLDQIPLTASNGIKQLPLYAFGGILVGLALALFRNWQRLRPGGHIRPATATNL
jgi:hypothetical protein